MNKKPEVSSPSSLSSTGTIDGWKEDPFRDNIIWGHVYGNPKFNEGEYVHTSLIQGDYPDGFKEGMVITTLNSTYLLGKERDDA